MGAGIFGVLLAALTLLFRTGVDYIRRTEAMLEMQMDALAAVTRLNNEGVNSNVDAFAFDPGPPYAGVIFASPLDDTQTPVVDAFGRVEWQKFVVYYLDTLPNGIPALLRKEKPMATPDINLPALPTLASIAGDGSLTAGLIARNVVEMQGDDPNTPAFDVSMLVQRDERGKLFGVRIATGLFFRN